MFIVLLFFLSCGHQLIELSPEQKKIEMDWLFNKITTDSYALFPYKKERFYQNNWEKMQKIFLDKAEKSESNEEFFRIKEEVINLLHDMHVNSIPMIPRDYRIKYLGFMGTNIVISENPSETGFLVTKYLPSVLLNEQKSFPLNIGDILVTINEKPYVKFVEELCTLKYSHPHQKNLQAAAFFPFLINRNCRIPDENQIKIQFIRNHQLSETTIFYEEKKLGDFFAQEEEALQKIYKKQSLIVSEQTINTSIYSDFPEIIKNLLTEGQKQDFWYQDFAFLSFENFFQENLLKKISFSPSLLPQKPLEQTCSSEISFQIPQVRGSNPFQKKFQIVLTNRPQYSGFLVGLPNHKTLAHIHIKNFINWTECSFKHFSSLLNILKATEPVGWIINLTDNPGGSLLAGYRVLGYFQHQVFKDFQIQLAPNANWIKRFEYFETSSPSIEQRVIAKSFKKNLLDLRKKGKNLSQPFPLSSLISLTKTKSSPQMVPSSQIFVLTNTGCASMCDIFTKSLQQQGVPIFGSQTAGAGGNASFSGSAPFSGDLLSLTESLILDQKGEPLENQGVKPNKKILFSKEDYLTGYQNSLEKITHKIIEKESKLRDSKGKKENPGAH